MGQSRSVDTGEHAMRTRPRPPCVRVSVFSAALGLGLLLCGPPLKAAIYRWGSGELIKERDAEPGADVHGMDLKPNP